MAALILVIATLLFLCIYSAGARESGSRQVPAQVKAEHIALVCILFSRLKEPQQLLQPLAPASTLPALQLSAKGLAGARITSTSSAQTSHRLEPLSTISLYDAHIFLPHFPAFRHRSANSALQRRLTEEHSVSRESCIELRPSDYAASAPSRDGKDDAEGYYHGDV